MTSISSSGQDAIDTTLDVVLDTSPHDLVDFYEIERTVEEIENGDYHRIGLQFPDNLLHHSVPIYRALKQRLGVARQLYVLADTTYGSCCVDEIAASHIEADVVVHYGYACLTRVPGVPVIYVFGKKEIDVEDCVEKVLDVLGGRREGLEIRYDPRYTHSIPQITQLLPPSSSPSPSSTIIYIGDESLHLTHLLLTQSQSQSIISYSPSSHSARLESPSTNKLFMRRYALIQKARDADVFGILVAASSNSSGGPSTLLPLLTHLRTLLKKSHKKSYTLSVGKLSPSKLANFMEIECFVLVACPENSLMDSKDFFKPIITPYELQVALADDPAEAWLSEGEGGSGYVLDSQKLLTRMGDVEGKGDIDKENKNEDGDGDGDDEDKPIFSLVTGTYRHPKRFGVQTSSANSATDPSDESGTRKDVIKTKDGTLTRVFVDETATATYLTQRTYQGLDPRVGKDEPSLLEQGRRGVARGYGGEN